MLFTFDTGTGNVKKSIVLVLQKKKKKREKNKEAIVSSKTTNSLQNLRKNRKSLSCVRKYISIEQRYVGFKAGTWGSSCQAGGSPKFHPTGNNDVDGTFTEV